MTSFLNEFQFMLDYFKQEQSFLINFKDMSVQERKKEVSQTVTSYCKGNIIRVLANNKR